MICSGNQHYARPAPNLLAVLNTNQTPRDPAMTPKVFRLIAETYDFSRARCDSLQALLLLNGSPPGIHEPKRRECSAF